MKRKWLILLLVGLIILLLPLMGCKKKEEAEPAAGNIFIIRLSNPDEVLNSIVQETDSSLWGKYLDRDAAIGVSDREAIGFHIGAKSANALLAVFLDDYDTAENIGGSIKNASEKLNIKSENVETVAKKLTEDLKEKDEETKARKVKSTLNLLKDEVIAALKSIGNQSEALMIEYGAWIEALRQTSGIVKDDYSARAASVLRRDVEAKYFKAEFQSLNIRKPDPKYRAIVDATSQLLELMQPDEQRTVPEYAVVKIHELTTQIYKQSAES
jgi:hypothetical protein